MSLCLVMQEKCHVLMSGLAGEVSCIHVLSCRRSVMCSCLVVQEKCHHYWPSERSARYQYFVVDPMTEYNMPQYILREFKVTDARVSTSCDVLFVC